MNHKQALTTAIFAISALATTAAQASYYRLYGRAQYQIFFGTSDNRQVDEVNGIKSWADTVSGSNPSDYARTDMTVKFGIHRGSILCQGLFSYAYGEARTEEDVTFSNPLGFPVRVRANLVGAATVGHPNQTQTQRASSTLSINGVVRIGYLDQYIGNSHQTNTPVPYEFEVPSGGTIRLYHQTIFQVAGTSTNQLYFVSCQNGIQVELKILTQGAKITTSTGARYQPVVPGLPRP